PRRRLSPLCPYTPLFRSLFEAAALDGAGLMMTLRRVIMPIISPGVAATALICFIFAWNEMLFARVLTGVTAGTAPVYLTGFVTRSEEHTSELQSRENLVC